VTPDEHVKLLAIMRPRDGIDVQREVAQHAASELGELWKLYRSGTLREMYSPGGPGAVLVLEADSVEAAQGALSQLPLLANEVMALELIELRPFAALQMLFRAGVAE
jgi:hypothetical protein